MFGFCSSHRKATERLHGRYFKRGLQTGSAGVFLEFSPLFISGWSYNVYDLQERLQNYSSANLFSNTLDVWPCSPLGVFRRSLTIVARIWNGNQPCSPSFKDGFRLGSQFPVSAKMTSPLEVLFSASRIFTSDSGAPSQIKPFSLKCLLSSCLKRSSI